MTSVVTTAPAVAPAAPPKTKSQALRSFDVADFPALTGREEEWRFTPLRRLRGLATADGSVSAGPALRHEYDGLPAGVSVSTVDKGDRRLGSVLTPFDRISALAWTHAAQAPRGSRSGTPTWRLVSWPRRRWCSTTWAA